MFSSSDEQMTQTVSMFVRAYPNVGQSRTGEAYVAVYQSPPHGCSHLDVHRRVVCRLRRVVGCFVVISTYMYMYVYIAYLLRKVIAGVYSIKGAVYKAGGCYQLSRISS
jgi:hypothetical protein